MKSRNCSKRMLSILLAVLMAAGSMIPAFSAFADGEGGIIGVYELQIFYDNGVIMPDFDDEEGKVQHIEYLKEGQKLQLKYHLVDCTIPDNGWVEWDSDTPTVCDVTPDGLVRAFDSSKGAAVRLWLDNEVGTIPLVGKIIKAALEKALFNDKVNVDTMDTDQIIAIVDAAFGEDSVLAKYIESYKGQLINSLREYLDKVNTTITCKMYDKEGTVIAEDSFQVCVQKSDDEWADLIPNGTHITNKYRLPTTVAKGSKLQLSACTTPTRLHMGVIYSVKNSSIFSSGKVVATVDSSGLVTFKNTGTVTILVSPDTEGFIDNILKYVNYVTTLPDSNGKVNCGKLADILIKYVGLDINRTVLVGILEACFVIADIVEDTSNPVQLTKTAAKVLANIVYQFTTNDSITFTVVDGIPVTDFEITGTNPTEKITVDNVDMLATPVKEGDVIAFGIDNVKPEAADASDIVWTSSNPAIASVDPETGAVTGRDAGGKYMIATNKSEPVMITATSKANNVSKSVYVIVKGKTGEYVSDAEIIAERTDMNLGEQQQLSPKIYPEKMAESKYLYIEWGLVPAETDMDLYTYDEADFAKEPFQTVDEEGNGVVDEEGNPVMNDGTVTDGIGKIDSNGVYTAVAGGTSKVIMRAFTGNTTFGKFHQISEVFAVILISNGRPVDSITVSASDVKKGSSISRNLIVHSDKEIAGKTYHYATVDYAGSSDGLGTVIKADVQPADATNKKVKWVVENTDDFKISSQDDENGTATVEIKGGREKAVSTNVYCMSQDGTVVSDVITVAFSKSAVTGNRIVSDGLEVINGKTADVSHEVDVSGSASKLYACYKANWYSDDEEIAVVESVDENGNAVIRGVDVGTTTLHCVSADGGIDAVCSVTVYPDKQELQEIITLCERTTIIRTKENSADYRTYMKRLDNAYYILEASNLASQTIVDNTAEDLIYIFYKLGGYIGINSITLLDESGNKAPDYVSVKASTSKPYTSAKYSFGYLLNPDDSMYKNISWESSSSDVTVNRYGVCSPAENKACYSTITVTVTDYLGNSYSDSAVVSFANTPVTGISVKPSSLTEQKVGTTAELEADLEPKAGLITSADIKDVIWSSSDESVATVAADSKNSRKAVVSFVYGGDCVITATTADGGLVFECTINVVTNYEPLIETINKYSSMVLPETSYYPDSYAVYTTAVADAQAMIDAQASTQKEVAAMVQRLDDAYKGLQKYNKLSGVEIYREGSPTAEYYQYDVSVFSKELLYTNVKFQLNVRLYPNNASYKDVVWSCDNPNIAIDNNGNCAVTENKPQTGVVTCTITDHFGDSWSDTVNVAITRFPVTGITFIQSEILGAVGSTQQIEYEISPKGTPSVGAIQGIGSATIKTVMWESDNENVATVDENGVVTFVAAGATIVRATTLDGGYTAECIVSTEGDRTALMAALNKYENIDYTDYDYQYGMDFKAAYDAAENALTDNSLTQRDIDAAAQALESIGSQLEEHKFIKAETINLNYLNEKQATRLSAWKDFGSGAIDAAAASYSVQTDNKELVDTRTTISASLADNCKSNYTDIKWNVISTSSSNIKASVNGASVTVNVTGKNSGYAVLKAAVTDVWGRTVERTIRVTLATEIVTGITLDQAAVTKPVTAQPFTLNATVNPSGAKVNDVIWYSSNEAVATVLNGVVTPVNSGTCVITAETADGGFKAECTVTLETDYSALEAAHTKYNDFIMSVLEEHIYTAKSLAVLQQAITDAAEMLNASASNQQQVDEMTARLNSAYDNLVLFIGVSGAEIIVPENQDHITVPNPGYVRYHANVINNASFRLESVFSPEDASPEEPVWSSSNSNITVTNDGVVKKSSNAAAESGIITVTYNDEAGNSASADIYVSFVRTAVESISFDKELTYGRPGTTQALKPTYSPALASIRSCVYESSAPEIVSVDENGVLTFNTKGEAVITATSLDGGFTASLKAYTTADTAALNAAIEEYSSVNYMDYAYTYGMAFKTAFEAAQAMSENYLADQQEIDNITAQLQTAYNELAGHEFIGTGEIALTSGGKAVENGMKLPVDAEGKVTVTADYNKQAMLKSAEYSVANANGVEAEITADGVVITKTTQDASASIDVVFTVTDDYDRQTTVIKSLLIVDAIVPISSFEFVYNGAEVSGSIAYPEQSTLIGINGKTIQLSINTYPLNAEEPKQILWNKTAGSDKISVDSNGLVKMGTGSLGTKVYTATITCTIILNDGTAISKSIDVTFSSKR